MSLRWLLVTAGLLTAVPLSAQIMSPQNAVNWDVFLKLYPPRALKAREEGPVGFLVTLNNKGDVTDCRVTHSSGHPLLDEETCKLVTLNAVFQPDPNLSPSQTRTHEGLIAWKLPASTAALSSPQPLAANSGPEKVICKKVVRTGTLSGFERTCMTQREWNRQSDATKEVWDEIQGRKGNTHGN
jgi:TonB family protein